MDTLTYLVQEFTAEDLAKVPDAVLTIKIGYFRQGCRSEALDNALATRIPSALG